MLQPVILVRNSLSSSKLCAETPTGIHIQIGYIQPRYHSLVALPFFLRTHSYKMRPSIRHRQTDIQRHGQSERQTQDSEASTSRAVVSERVATDSREFRSRHVTTGHDDTLCVQRMEFSLRLKIIIDPARGRRLLLA